MLHHLQQVLLLIIIIVLHYFYYYCKCMDYSGSFKDTLQGHYVEK